jgi:hypothetical protein
MTNFVFPLQKDGSVHPDAVFLAHMNLIYGDLKPTTEQGKRFVLKGETFTFSAKDYPEILKFPTRVQLLIDGGKIEYLNLPVEPVIEPVSAENEE